MGGRAGKRVGVSNGKGLRCAPLPMWCGVAWRGVLARVQVVMVEEDPFPSI